MASNEDNNENNRAQNGNTTPVAADSTDAPPDKMAEEINISYVVGIGASAGGIEAFGDFLTALPEHTGMAFILVQHLDPVHESMLGEIFSRKTAVPVEQARHGVPIEPDHVYIIPPNKHIDITDGHLVLSPRETGAKFMPIDKFFNSLADTWQNRAICIILSGTGNDGTNGLRSIKAAGGLTFTQDKESSRYPDMPINAAAEGGADFVLPPDRIALELARIAKNPLIVKKPPPRKDAPEPSEEDTGVSIDPIYRLLKSSTGTDFSYYKPNTIRRRIARRMMILRLETVPEYIEFLKNNAGEQEALANDLFINVTSFFRDPESFDMLRESVLPELIKDRHPDAPLRVWIPGCSTGEEVYSLAICLVEAAGEKFPGKLIQIYATDISGRVIERARSGIYPESISADVSEERLRRFFTRTDGGYQINKYIRDMCVFARQDLTKDPPFSRMDLISCRNVLIYLAAPHQKRIISTFHYSLNPDGFLLLGSSESVGVMGSLFTPADHRHKIYRKKQGPPYLGTGFVIPDGREEKGAAGGKRVAETTAFDVQKEADRIFLATYAPGSILINDQMDIVQFRGLTGRYMEPSSGTASLNLMKILKEELLQGIRALISQARTQNVSVQRRDVPFKVEEQSKKVDINVVPVRTGDTLTPGYFLVVFREFLSALDTSPDQPQPAYEPPEQQDQLRQELQATREYLQTVTEDKDAMNEEFRSAMEEIQSSNEELQSTNEELETTKEELQSTNEELMTVNEEMQNRNVELGRINDDLLNLLSNVSLPLIILTRDLRIRRYTTMTESILNLIPSDVGRPLSDLRTKIAFPDLEEILKDVLDNLIPRELEVQDPSGTWHKLRIRPFTTQEKKIDGLVLTLLDIDEMKRAMDKEKSSQRFCEAVIQTIREPLLVLDGDLRVVTGNREFYRTFRVDAAETEGNLIFNLGNGQWNIPELRRLLLEILPQNASFDDYVIEHDFPQLGTRRMVLNARRMQAEDVGGDAKILLAIEEHRGEP